MPTVRLAEISIRGRMGYAITCFEKTIMFYKAQTPQIEKLLSFLWEYTQSIQLDLWEEEFTWIVPESLKMKNTIRHYCQDVEECSN